MKCRNCENELTNVFLDLGYSPAANTFPTDLTKPEIWYPLKVWICEKCWLVQMDEHIPATEIFNEDYPYYSSHSENNVVRAKAYVEMMCERFNIGKWSNVLEIGSNDGYLLQWFNEKGAITLGIDPARNAAKEARKRGVRTDVDFFSSYKADDIFKCDLICGSNVLAHQPNISDFIEGLKIALKPEGIITMEFPTLLNMLTGACQFDSIYQEHFNYLSFFVVCEMFKKHGLEVFDVLHTPEQGGSIMIIAQHEGGKHETTESVSVELYHELVGMQMNTLGAYQGMQKRVEKTKLDLLDFLIFHRLEKVAAYGGSCKCNTLFNYIGIKPDLVKFVVDRSPLKQGHYLPGSHIPIVDEEYLKRERPDYVIITAWNLKDEIMKQLQYTREWGCKFILTTPKLEVI
jgi:SAM-dependent methyltransferase